jgi:RHS repeat-associated protein
LPQQDIAYTPFKRPATITENGLTAQFLYNASYNRSKMRIMQGNNLLASRYYIGGCYEYDSIANREILYLNGDPYSAPAVFVKENGNAGNIYYICRDYQGNITHITNSSGSLVQELSYDPWGRLRNPTNQSVYTPGSEPAPFLGRGYSGHEHLTQFGLINMNARLYDPLLGRFLSPDPYVQMPEFSQSFNRYSYCLNNPLKYTDPDGEFLIGYLSGWFRGLFTGKNPFKTGWESGVNEVKIEAGLFTFDRNKSFWGQTWEIVSRFTWQLPQTMVGNGFSQISNYAGQVDKVDYWGGATVLSGRNWGQTGAVTMSSYIIGGPSLAADPNNSLFQHEYGHYLQSQEMGWGYLSRVGIPSLMDAWNYDDGNHKYQPFEQDANRRAFMYFNEHVDGFYQTEAEWRVNQRNDIKNGWDFRSNPLDVNHIGKGSRGIYSDYYNTSDINLINSLTLSAKWYDYLGGIVLGIPTGIGNGIHYNKHRVK